MVALQHGAQDGVFSRGRGLLAVFPAGALRAPAHGVCGRTERTLYHAPCPPPSRTPLRASSPLSAPGLWTRTPGTGPPPPSGCPSRSRWPWASPELLGSGFRADLLTSDLSSALTRASQSGAAEGFPPRPGTGLFAAGAACRAPGRSQLLLPEAFAASPRCSRAERLPHDSEEPPRASRRWGPGVHRAGDGPHDGGDFGP